MSKNSRLAIDTSLPDAMPVLARGRHRTPRGGACFMEYASFLAGERWSDHPACTHPTVARLARMVNDSTSDSERGRLAEMISSVVGLVAAGNRASGTSGASDILDLTIALIAASASLPIASEPRQRALAVTVIRCSDRLEQTGSLPDRLREQADAALADTPQATLWARRQIASVPFRGSPTTPIATEAMIVLAVTGIAEACTIDVDGTLRAVLFDAIEEARAILLPAAPSIAVLQTA